MATSYTLTAQKSYAINVTGVAKTARLIHQSRLFTTALGDLFPAGFDLAGVRRVLDIGCGPGEWTLDVAQRYPHLEVTGIDLDPGMVRYAQTSAWSQDLDDCRFEVMDARQPLRFADGSFDLVNARCIAGFMDRASWPDLLAECCRILAPGGRLLLHELEMHVSSSPALQQLYRYLTRACYRQKRSFSPDGCSLGITHALGKLLKGAGFGELRHQPFLLDGSADSALFYDAFKNMEYFFASLKPYLLDSAVVEEAAFDDCYNQMMIEMLSDDFTFLSYGLVAWGTKP